MGLLSYVEAAEGAFAIGMALHSLLTSLAIVTGPWRKLN